MIGPILGTAFDRALGVMVRHWLVFLAAWAVLACTSIFDHLPGAPIDDLAGCMWLTVAGVLATRDAFPNLRADASLVLRLWAASIWYLVSVIVPPLFIVVMALPIAVNGDGAITHWAPLIAVGVPAVAYMTWTGTKWSLSSLIAVLDGRRAFSSLRSSWSVTNGAFWATFLLGVTVFGLTIAIVFVGLVIVGIAAILVSGETRGTNFMSEYGQALITPIGLYLGVANSIAYIRFLIFLRSRETQRINAGPGAPSVSASVGSAS